MLIVDELWLKGNNRHLYFKALKDHIEQVTRNYHMFPFVLKKRSHRYILKSQEDFSKETLDALACIPGLNKITLVEQIPPVFEKIAPAIIEKFHRMTVLPHTFKLKAKRIDKNFSMASMKLVSVLGEQICSQFPTIKVNLQHPEVTVDIKIFKDHIYLSTEELPCIGGLPVGMSGHLITMLSGGIDSPVASFMMSKRGVKQTFLFFYAYPFVGEKVKDKIFELARKLGRYQKGALLYSIPFGEFQKELSKRCRESYRTVFFRHYMIVIADRIASKLKAGGLLTGDSLGQVSSQTLSNISMLEKSSTLPILRPLIGYNKSEIIDIAKKIDTFEISIRPYDDACALFSSQHPVIKMDRKYWKEFLDKEDFNREIELSLSSATIWKIHVDNTITKFSFE